MLKNKKGVSQWISWVLLMGLAIALGTGFYYWMQNYTEESTAETILRADYAILCEDAGVSITNVCQNTQTLNMNLTNSNNLRVKGLVFRIFDIYDMPQTVEWNETIDPQETKNVVIVKQGISNQLELIPIIYSGKNRLICTNRKTTVENVLFC
ncbi:MAG: hypothetical protein GY861_04430 [bacterium]|nr:hypothetical protein [bacterium]